MKSRVPLQVAPIFNEELKELQKYFKENGHDKSLRDITEDIAKLGILKKIRVPNIKEEIKIKLDKRRI